MPHISKSRHPTCQHTPIPRLMLCLCPSHSQPVQDHLLHAQHSTSFYLIRWNLLHPIPPRQFNWNGQNILYLQHDSESLGLDTGAYYTLEASASQVRGTDQSNVSPCRSLDNRVDTFKCIRCDDVETPCCLYLRGLNDSYPLHLTHYRSLIQRQVAQRLENLK